MAISSDQYFALLQSAEDLWREANVKLADWDSSRQQHNRSLEEFEFIARKKLEQVVQLGVRMRRQNQLA